MSIDTILSQHKAWLDKATAALASRNVAVTDLTAPLQAKQQLVDRLEARIDDLNRQKAAAVARYESAIADAKGLQGKLQQDLKANSTLLKPAEAPDKPPAPAKPPT
jgi:chromosome segregation ATPase